MRYERGSRRRRRRPDEFEDERYARRARRREVYGPEYEAPYAGEYELEAWRTPPWTRGRWQEDYDEPERYPEDDDFSETYGPARYGYGPYYERLQRRRRSDAEISEEVMETLFYDTWVDADSITVTVEDGIVTLAGTLPSYDEVRYATDDAWDVEGVRGVRSELRVQQLHRSTADLASAAPSEAELRKDAVGRAPRAPEKSSRRRKRAPGK